MVMVAEGFNAWIAGLKPATIGSIASAANYNRI